MFVYLFYSSCAAPQSQYLDGNVTHVLSVPSSNIVMINGTLIHIILKKPFRDSQINELLYVIIVIVFYATALMTLIITQIKRQRREGMDVDYYDEYLQRNQEVKRTCQTATTIVLKTDRSPVGPGSALVVPAAGGSTPGASTSLLPPVRRLDSSPRSGVRHQGLNRGEEGSYTPNISPREISPMLESIPDVGT